jgi:hypothetical protein
MLDWKTKWPFRPVEEHKNLKSASPPNTREREFYQCKMATLKDRWARQAFRRYQRSQHSPRQNKPSRSKRRCHMPGAWVEDPFETSRSFRYRQTSGLLWWLYLLALAVAFLASRSFIFQRDQIQMLGRISCENSDLQITG